MQTKTCTQCKEEKPATTEYFHSEKRSTDGIRSCCKPCRNKLEVESTKNPDRQTKIKSYRNKRSAECNAAYAQGAGKGNTKVCTSCGTTKPAKSEFFHKSSLGVYGLESKCKVCINKLRLEWRNSPEYTKWYQDNRDVILQRCKVYNAANSEKIAARNAEKYKNTPREVFNAAHKLKRERNIEHYRAKGREKEALLRKDPSYRLKQRISTRINQLLKGGKCGQRTYELLGYSDIELKEHIERQFTDGMSWDEFMKGKIHIDHILPVSMFNIETHESPDFKVCWGLPNLRPLWAFDNLSKGSKLVSLL